MKKFYILVGICLSVQLWAQDSQIQDYIERYKDIAIEEMHRSGIPASIKLAQAILESDAGNSDLAQNSNNHFGMKCGPVWSGGTFFKKDDDRDRRGRLIKSCFRMYDTPEESFVAHTEFLTNPAKAYRYGPLFDIDQTDYKSWAWGLKKSGYATNPRYANLLISLIQQYHLYSYDYYERNEMVHQAVVQMVAKNKQLDEFDQLPQKDTREIRRTQEDIVFSVERRVLKNNRVKMVYAQAGDTPYKIASDLKVLVSDILTYNENLQSADQELEAFEYVYLEEKKKRYKGNTKTHLVQLDDDMYSIAQKYGVQLDKLYLMNRLKEGMEPFPGEKVVLRGMVKVKERPKIRLEQIEQVVVSTEPARPVRRYIVQHGDTLYSIAKHYQVTVEDIKRQNQLNDNLIEPGQVIVIDDQD